MQRPLLRFHHQRYGKVGGSVSHLPPMRWGSAEHLALVETLARAAYGTSFPNDTVKRQHMEIVGGLFLRADPADIVKLMDLTKHDASEIQSQSP